MHNDNPEVACALDDIEEIIHAPAGTYRTLGERAGAYAALCERTSFLRERLEEQELLSGYGSQKLVEVLLHGGGMLGFGERRKREAGHERTSAFGSFSVLRGVVKDALGGS